MAETEPVRQFKQFRGRDWLAPASKAKTATADGGPPPLPGAAADPDAAPHGRLRTSRDLQFERYAELRRQLDTRPHDEAVLCEAAKIAEDLCLTIEAMELWRECLRLDPSHPAATKQLAGLERRAAATGETGSERSTTAKTREQPPEAPPFWTHFGSILSYPFRGRGLGVFVGASIFFAVGEVISTLNVFFGWFVMLCLLGYLAAWQFDVLSRTAAGKDDPPEFPELVTIVDSCVLPVLGFLGCALFAFAPMILVGALTVQGTIPATPGVIAMLALFIPCGFVFPMTVTVRALTQSIGEAMTPSRVYGSIGRVLPDYLIAFVSLCALWFGWSAVRVGLLFGLGLTFGLPTADAVLRLDYLRIVGWLIYTAAVWPLLLYVWCVQGHLLGCLYRQSYKRLAWFVPAGAETQKAKRLSFAVALAGAGGALLLVAGGWLTYLMWPGDRANAALSGGPGPVVPGVELTYFWESTDGPAGLATYTFEEQGADRMTIVAGYKRAGDWGVSSSKGSVGVVDRKNGVLLRGDGEESGIGLHEKQGRHSRFWGPKRGSLNATYLNDWSIRGDLLYKGRWHAWRVIEPETSAELYYDKTTGVLVGRKITGVGFTVTEWLTSAKGLAGLANCPPPNRSFEEPAEDSMPRFEDGYDPPPSLPPGGPRRYAR